jgi:hypothetical protein
VNYTIIRNNYYWRQEDLASLQFVMQEEDMEVANVVDKFPFLNLPDVVKLSLFFEI